MLKLRPSVVKRKPLSFLLFL